MRFIKEEDHARLLRIADFGQLFIQLGHHPQQEGRVDQRACDQALAGKNVDVAAARGVGVHPVVDVKTRLAEEDVAALVLKGEKRTLDRADAGSGDVAVLGRKLGAVIADILEHGSQILQVKQQQAVVVRHAENDVQNAGLDLGQTEQTAEKRRAHFGYRHSDRVTLLAENIPEAGRVRFEGKVFDAEAVDPLLQAFRRGAGNAHAGQVALDVAQENGHAHIGERFGHDLHRHGLARAGRTGDNAVAVRHLRQEIKIFIFGLSHPYLVISKHHVPPYSIFLLISVY